MIARDLVRLAAALLCVAGTAGAAEPVAPNPPPAIEGITGLKPWQVRPDGSAKMPLVGGLSTTDTTVFRMFYPSSFVVDRTPHYHLGTEYGVVLSGKLHLGFGRCLKPEEAQVYGPGSFFAIPAGTPHFEWFEGDLYIQVTSVGPMNGVPIKDGCKPAE